jgi:ABC-type amino acid transport substrate-binding protein
MPQAKTKEWCSGGSCVDAVATDNGVLVTSTVPGNNGYVLFTRDEWDTFIPAVKAGKWDHTLSGVLVS